MQSNKEVKETDELNQREIAEKLGLSRASIQKIEEQALKKFRRELLRRNIKIADLL
jgi:DNA-directed RNA polymerase specialized sigma subunit